MERGRKGCGEEEMMETGSKGAREGGSEGG
jgi:hypothetical protein